MLNKSRTRNFSKRHVELSTAKKAFRSKSSYRDIKPPLLQPNSSNIFERSKADHKTLLTTLVNSSKFSSISTSCWCLHDEKTNNWLGYRQHYQRQIASLTKIMTLLLGLQIKQKYSLSSNILIRITDGSVKNIGTTAGLKYKNWILLKDLFYGILLPSGNDAAHLLAEFMGYILVNLKKDQHFKIQRITAVDFTMENTSAYLNEFIRKMNLKAQKLGMTFTRFSNPHGLQNAMNISTAKDVLTLSIHASKNTKFRKIMNTESHRCYQYHDESRIQKDLKIWENTNILLKEGWEGIKTGQTVTAGNCLASLKDGVYIVVLNCPDSSKRFTETKRLFNWYSEKMHELTSTLNSSSESFQL